jgi:DNA-binding NarL/FixJ family response regulator
MIGEDLYITEDTVKHHIKRILRNLGAHDRAHAVHLAWWHGLIGGNLRPLKRVV